MTFPSDDPSEHPLLPPEITSCNNLPLREQRALLFQILYAADAADYNTSLRDIMERFATGFSCRMEPQGFIAQRAEVVITSRDALDEVIKPLLHNWKFERLSVSTKLILRLALWELMHTELDTPVIINEALELARSFAEHDAHKFVNGLLDEWVSRHGRSSKPQVTDSPST